jgi:hypothetical protein
MNQPGNHHAEWKKAVTKGHLLYDPLHMKFLEQANLKRLKMGGKMNRWGIIVKVITFFEVMTILQDSLWWCSHNSLNYTLTISLWYVNYVFTKLF